VCVIRWSFTARGCC